MEFKTSVPLLWLVKTEHQSSVSHPSLQRRPTEEERSSLVPLGLDRASRSGLTEHLVSSLCPLPDTSRSTESKVSVSRGKGAPRLWLGDSFGKKESKSKRRAQM